MRRWAAVAFIAWCGCNSGSLEGGRYKCTYNGQLQDEQQCPGDWRCGLEGYCHHYNDTSVKWRCNTAADCELSWVCGLDDARDAGQCHDPDPAHVEAWACDHDLNCTAGWHCGPDRRCYDRTAPTAFSCRQDAGDCADGWRCGLDNRCQDTMRADAYTCKTDAGLDDTWCEQQWRCAPSGLCIDPAGDALPPQSLSPIDGGVFINPVIKPAPKSHFSFSPLYESGPGKGLQTEIYLQDGGAHAIMVDRLGSSFAHHYDLGALSNIVAVAAQGSRSMHYRLPQQLYYEDDNVTRAFFAKANGDVLMAELYLDGTSNAQAGGLSLIQAPMPITRLTIGSAAGNLPPLIVAFSEAPSIYAHLFGDGEFDNDFADDDDYFDAYPGNHIVDVASVRTTERTSCDFTVDARGLWMRNHDLNNLGTGYFHTPIMLPPFTNDWCADPDTATHRVTGLTTSGRDWLGVSSTQLDGGGNFVSVLDLRRLWTGPETEYCHVDGFIACDDPPTVDITFGPCPACPQRLLDFAVTVDALNQPRIDARCGTEDGGTAGFYTFSPRPGGATCQSALSDGEQGPFARTRLISQDQVTPGQVAWGGEDGITWTGKTATTAASMFFDRAPEAIARLGTGPSDTRLFTSTLTGTAVEGFGVAVSPVSGVLSAVEHQPEWVITDNRQVLDLHGAVSVAVGRPIGLIGSAVTPIAKPVNATVVRTSDAAQTLVISAGSSLFAGDLEPVLAGQVGFATIGLRVIAPAQLESIAFPDQSPPGALIHGYAVSAIGLLEVTAESLSRWTFADVQLPPGRHPLEVWFQGDRGRVGLSDGVVFSLPSRVLIASALPGGVAIDFTQACGQQFALGLDGPYRLESTPGSPVGAWLPVTLPAGFSTTQFASGRLHTVGGDLFVFNANGEGARLPVGCGP